MIVTIPGFHPIPQCFQWYRLYKVYPFSLSPCASRQKAHRVSRFGLPVAIKRPWLTFQSFSMRQPIKLHRVSLFGLPVAIKNSSRVPRYQNGRTDGAARGESSSLRLSRVVTEEDVVKTVGLCGFLCCILPIYGGGLGRGGCLFATFSAPEEVRDLS